ncbi:MAG: prenyltransferase/squalene oxidase repeat-containing protein, partial [Armatimonadota bacterium]
MRYLQRLDELISAGTDGLSTRLCEAQVAFLKARQNADGGFGGRDGSSDIYYTDFGLRTASI